MIPDAANREREPQVDVETESAIGTRVKRARQRLGWSREALAFHSGVSWSGVAQIESNRRTNLRPGTLTSLADALGVTVDYLVSGRPAPVLLEHKALLYEDDESFVATAGPYLRGGIDRSEALLAATTPRNIALLREHLAADADQVEFVEFASSFGSPADAITRFRDFTSTAIESGASWVRLLAEPIWVGRSRSEVRVWSRLESLLNLVFAAWPLTMLCPYDARVVPAKVIREVLWPTHPETITSEGLRGDGRYADPAGFILEPGS
jgi:transcriptional regulator with XRE-family HTH domain